MLVGIFVLVLCGVPLLIAPGVSFHYDVTPKAVVLLLGAGAILLLPGAWRAGFHGLLQDAVGRLFLMLIAAQVISLAVSTMLSADPALSYAGSNWRRLGLVTHGALLVFVLGVACRLGARPAELKLLLRAMTVAGTLAACYGLLQYFGWDPLLPPASYYIGEGIWTIVRPPGPLGHAGYFATCLVHVVFLALALVAVERSAGWRRFGIAAAAFCGVVVVLTGTRAAMVGLCAGAVVAWVWYRPRASRRWFAAAGLAALAAVVFYVSPAGERLRARTRWYIEDPQGGARPWLWRDTLRMASVYWPAGAGPETFSSEFPRFQSEGLAQAFPNYYSESPHNVFLDALASQGAAGPLILGGLLLLAAVAARRARSNREAGLLAAALVAGLVSNQFLSFTIPTALYFYTGLGLLLVLTGDGAGAKERKPAVWARALSAAGGVLLVVFAVQLTLADWGMANVQRSIEGGQLAAAERGYQALLRVKPPGVYYDLWYSRQMATAAQQAPHLGAGVAAWKSAWAAAERAVSASDARQNAHYSLAAFQSVENDFQRTEASLRAAIELAPNWYKPHWMLARLLLVAGRLEEARAEAARAMELNNGVDAEVAQTWREFEEAGNPPRQAQELGGLQEDLLDAGRGSRIQP